MSEQFKNGPLRKLGLAGFSALIAMQPLVAQDFEGKKITGVDVTFSGPKTVDAARIRNFMSIREGQLYDSSKLDDDIRSLYESGLVDDVRFLAEQSDSGVRLIAEVATRPSLAGVGFVGNTVFSDRKLAKESGLEAGGPLSDQKIISARRKIEEAYQSSGYPDVDVNYRSQESEQQGYADLVFVIEEGVRNEVRKIRFEGNQAFSDIDLRREMGTKQKNIWSFFTKAGKLDNDRFEEDLDKIVDFYRSNGYLRARVGDVQRIPVKDGRLDLSIPIEEGVKYTVAGVGFGKMSVFTAEELMPALRLTGGKAYSAKKMRDDIQTIRSYYGSKGYADASIVPDIRDAAGDSVNIIYKVSEGGRYKVGRVNIAGNTKTKDNVIRRELPLKPGDNFNSADLSPTRKRLENLQFFNSVQVLGKGSSQAGYRDLDIEVEEGNTGSLGLGVGLGSDDGVVGFVNVEQRNFDIQNPPRFTGGGQKFSASLRLGSERQEARVSLYEPWFLGKKLGLGGELFFSSAQFFSDTYDQENAGGRVWLRTPIDKHSYAQFEYRLENIEIDLDNDTPATSQFVTRGFEGDFTRSALSASYNRNTQDSNLIVRKGGRLEAELEVAFGGDVELYKASISGAHYWNMRWDTIFSLQGEFVTVDDYGGNEVPVFDRLALGGSSNLRGFDVRDVGPRDTGETDDVFGGQTSGFISAEVTFPIVENIRGAAFYDVGFVQEDAWDFGASDLYSDIGLGLRLYLPLGPLAIDYAFPVSSPDDLADEGGRFNFYLNFAY